MKTTPAARWLAAKLLLPGSLVLAMLTVLSVARAGSAPATPAEISAGGTPPAFIREPLDVTIEIGSFGIVNCAVDDLETDASDLEVTAHSSNPEVVPDSRIGVYKPLGNDIIARGVRLVPGMTGETEITLTVTDKDGNSASTTFKVQVVPKNGATVPLDPLGLQLGLATLVNDSSPGAQFPTAGAQFPVPALEKGDFKALGDINADTLPLSSIDHFWAVENVRFVNLPGGGLGIQADVGLRLEIGGSIIMTMVDAGTISHFAGDPTLGPLTTPRMVPVGPGITDPVRPDGDYFEEIIRPQDTEPGSLQAPRGVWTYQQNFAPTGIGLLTHDAAANVVKVGDPVPPRPASASKAAGTTFTIFSNQDLAVNDNYVAFGAAGDGFSGVYTKRLVDGVFFSVVEDFPSSGPDRGVFFHGDRELVIDTAGGIALADAEGATTPEVILPGVSGIKDFEGDLGVTSDGNEIWLFNVVDHSVQEIVKVGDPIPGSAETFGSFGTTAASPNWVVFYGYDSSFKFVGLFAYLVVPGELIPVLRVGDTISDGREVKDLLLERGGMNGPVLGFTAYFTDGSGAAMVAAMDTGFTVPFLNISTRARVETDDNVLIAGFIITPQPAAKANKSESAAGKKVIVRAIGPSLGALGVPEALEDPVLELHMPDGSVVTNDDWRDDQEQEIIDTTIPPNDDLESAIVATLEPGAYTAIVRGKSGGTGVGVVEVYDLDGAAVSEQANLSTRSLVQTGDNVMIGGIIVGGASDTASTIVVRAIGPSLANLGVADALEDPVLELHDSFGDLLTTNDDWKETQQSELEAAGLAPTDDRESAIETALFPGAYTAIVRGKNDTTGVALVEAYNLEASGSAAAGTSGLTNPR